MSSIFFPYINMITTTAYSSNCPHEYCDFAEHSRVYVGGREGQSRAKEIHDKSLP